MVVSKTGGLKLFVFLILIELVDAQFHHYNPWSNRYNYGYHNRYHHWHHHPWSSGGYGYRRNGIGWGTGLAVAGAAFVGGFVGSSLGSYVGNGLTSYSPYNYYYTPPYYTPYYYYPQYTYYGR